MFSRGGQLSSEIVIAAIKKNDADFGGGVKKGWTQQIFKVSIYLGI